MTPVLIFGCGGLSAVVRDTLLRAGQFEPIGFLTSDQRFHGRLVDRLGVLGGLDAIEQLRHGGVEHAIVAIGDNATRVRIAQELKSRSLQLASAIHPLASISPTAELGEHLIIGARAIISTNAHIGAHSVISAGAIIEHDNHLSDGVFLHPAVRLAGGVCVEELATIGVGACVIPGRRIGRCAVIEPGTVVIRDVADGDTVAGVPGRITQSATSRFQQDHPQDANAQVDHERIAAAAHAD